MRFLFLCTKYPVRAGDSYMTSELAAALVREGHSVDVVLLDWDALPGSQTERHVHDGINIVRIAPRAWTRFGTLIYRASKFILSDRHAVAEMRREIQCEDYDACVAWMPALTVSGPLRMMARTGVRHRLLFIWDFFPIHHKEIGLVPPGIVFRVAKWAEERALASCTAFLTLLPSNMAYLRRHYGIQNQYIGWTPIWTDIALPKVEDRNAVRTRYGLPLDRPIAIFGGQITQGRGIEMMLDAARVTNDAGSPVLFLFVGDGRLAGAVKQAEQNESNIRHVASVPRDEYLSLVAACDVGLVATVEGVSSHTFPSKTLDYLRVSIPIVAAVEPGNIDYLNLIDDHRLGGHAQFDAVEFGHAVMTIAADTDLKKDLATRSRDCLRSMFDVSCTVAALDAAFVASHSHRDRP
jgi:glycosyltransferase involved in cell wall biosynthesis